MMTEPHLCIECKSELPEDAPEGLCPNCLLKLALDAASDSLAALAMSDVPSLAGKRVHYFGDYELLEEIARGGMGVVYKARQMSLNRIVAVKMMRPGLIASESEVQRFRIEAEAAASLQHPGIVAIHEVGEHDGMCYFSMDYVEGRSLSEVVRNQPLSARKAAAYVKAVAEAVHFAHERGVLHRDLKPANVIIDTADQPRITDFGLARRIESDSRLTETGAVLGTPSYMPPEQARGKLGQLSPASDVYSLGAMLYELVTGRPPFQAETPVDTLMLALHTEPIAPRMLNPKLDRDIETICLKCLEKDARRRYQSAGEMADDLGRFLEHKPIKARSVGRINRGWRWCRRNPWAATAACVLVLLAVVASVFAFTLRERLWRSMIEQARSERLAGNRARSMELLAEAAWMKKSEELRQEAIQTIATPGLKLRNKIPFINSEKVVISADSKLLAVGGRKQESHEYHTQYSSGVEGRSIPKIEVWDLESGTMISKIDHNISDNGRELTFSPTEPVIATSQYRTETKQDAEAGYTTSSSIEAVILWSAITSEKIAEIKCQGEMCGEINGEFVFSPDGRRLVKGGYDCAGWLIDVPARSGNTVCLEGRPVAFLSNDELLLDCDGRLGRRDISTRKHGFISPEGTELVSLSKDGRVALLRSSDSLILLDIQANKKTTVATGIREDQSEAILSGDGRIVAVMNKLEPNTIYLYEVTATGIKHKTIALGSNTKVFLAYDQAAFSPDGSFFAAFGGEGKQGSVWVWDTQTGAEVGMLRGNCLPIWSGDSRLLITRGPGIVKTGPNSTFSSGWGLEGIKAGNSYVNVWEVFPSTPIYLLPDTIDSMAFTPDGKQFLSNGVTWDIVAMRDRVELQPTPQRLPADSKVFAVGDQLWAAYVPQKDFILKLWQLAPVGREIALENPDYSGLKTKLEGEPFARPGVLDFSPDGRFIVMVLSVSSRSGWKSITSLELWELAERRRIAIWNNIEGDSSFISIKFSPDGKLVATAPDAGNKPIVIRETATGREIGSIKKLQLAHALAFSPDGKLLFSAGSSLREGDESPIFVNEVETGRAAGVWKSHHEGVKALAISPDGKVIASGGEDRLICLWDVPSGRKLAAWEAHKTGVTALAFSPDGRTLASGSHDGTLKLWDLPFIRRELSTIGLGW